MKRSNDLHGHVGGDDVLRAVAQLLKGQLRSHGDIAARLGGAECALLCFVPVKGFLDTRLQLLNSIMPPFFRLPRNSRGAAAQVA